MGSVGEGRAALGNTCCTCELQVGVLLKSGPPLPVMTVRLTAGPWTRVTAGVLEEQTDERMCSWIGAFWSIDITVGDSILVILTSSPSWSIVVYSDAVLLMASPSTGDT